MRVKVGETWFEPENGIPVAVELTQIDKDNIKSMPADAKRLGVFSDDESMNELEMLAWLRS